VELVIAATDCEPRRTSDRIGDCPSGKRARTQLFRIVAVVDAIFGANQNLITIRWNSRAVNLEVLAGRGIAAQVRRCPKKAASFLFVSA